MAKGTVLVARAAVNPERPETKREAAQPWLWMRPSMRFAAARVSS